MSVLLNLPQDLFRSIISEELEANTLAELDSAMCSTLLRPMYLTSVVNVPCCIPSTEQCHAFYLWVYNRKMKLAGVVIDQEMMLISERYPLDLEVKDFTNVHSQYFLRPYSLINSCTRLTSLSCCSTFDLSEVSDQILAQLKELILVARSSICNSSTTLRVIHDKCHNLKTLKCPLKPRNMTVMSEIMHRNPGLQTLEVAGDETLLESIKYHCSSSLINLTIRGVLKLSAFADVLRKCLHLRTLNIKCGTTVVEYCRYSSIVISNIEFMDAVPATENFDFEDWESFASELKGVTNILTEDLDDEQIPTALPLLKGNTSTLTSLTIQPDANEETITFALKNCKCLKTLEVDLKHHISWFNLLRSTSNVLERVTLGGCKFVDSHVKAFLSHCPRLKSFFVSVVILDMGKLHTMVDTIRSYKNTQDVPFECRLDYSVGSNTTWVLMWDGENFLGEAWRQYRSLMMEVGLMEK